MNTWFTSDPHFLHENIIKHSARPFTSAIDMEWALIEKWNTKVQRGDTIYCIGDFALSRGAKSKGYIDSILSRLNGEKWLITGNHDRKEVTKNTRWHKVVPYHEIKLNLGGIHKQRIVMCHYAMRVWNQSHRGAWMLHGHSHGDLSDIGGKTMDVGVDCHNYEPIGIPEIARYMESRTFQAVDHHTK